MKALIFEFLKNYTSKNTIIAYKKDLNDFFNFINKDLKDLNKDDFISYRDLLIKNTSLNSVNRKLASVTKFMEFLIEKGLLIKNPIKGLKIPRPQVSNPTQAFSDAEVRKIFSLTSILSFEKNLEKTILSLLFFTGLRRSEVANIKLRDIQEFNEYLVIKILGKGGKVREVVLNSNLKKVVLEYIDNYNKFCNSKLEPKDYLLQSVINIKNKKPINSSRIYRTIKKYSNLANINKNVSPHSCRATVITKALELGTPITEVADLAGHSNISTTQIYWKRRKGIMESPLHKVSY